MEKYTVDITDDALKDMEALYEYCNKATGSRKCYGTV